MISGSVELFPYPVTIVTSNPVAREIDYSTPPDPI
jgi:hypothetical protein